MLLGNASAREQNDVVFLQPEGTTSFNERVRDLPQKIKDIWNEIRACDNNLLKVAVFLDKLIVALGTYGIYYLTNQKSTLHAGISTFLNLFL